MRVWVFDVPCRLLPGSGGRIVGSIMIGGLGSPSWAISLPFEILAALGGEFQMRYFAPAPTAAPATVLPSSVSLSLDRPSQVFVRAKTVWHLGELI